MSSYKVSIIIVQLAKSGVVGYQHIHIAMLIGAFLQLFTANTLNTLKKNSFKQTHPLVHLLVKIHSFSQAILGQFWAKCYQQLI
jgi:hypothetical protein